MSVKKKEIFCDMSVITLRYGFLIPLAGGCHVILVRSRTGAEPRPEVKSAHLE